jgi:hypothetical protein
VNGIVFSETLNAIKLVDSRLKDVASGCGIREEFLSSIISVSK